MGAESEMPRQTGSCREGRRSWGKLGESANGRPTVRAAPSHDNPAQEHPTSTLSNREKGSSSLAKSCTPMESTCTIQRCILKVNPKSAKYWDPKEANGGP